MSGTHHHHHDHHHDAPATFGLAFAIGIALNGGFVILEGAYGILYGSMALVADAGHNLSDVLGLVIAYAASVLAARVPTARFTYGFKASSILAALINASLLLVALGAILVETLRRLFDPAPVMGGPIMAIAAIGIVINTITALMFMRGRHHDINIRGAYLHMAADAAVSAGVVVAGFLITLTGWRWIDPVTSLLIVGVIAYGTWDLLSSALKMGLHGVPAAVDERAVQDYLCARPGVRAVHDLHIWPMSTTETALTAHLVIPAGHPGDAFIHALAHELEHDFGVHHTTFQIETEGHDCHGCEAVTKAA
jgi:cobalt-zinc-cadmium efflux system protein